MRSVVDLVHGSLELARRNLTQYEDARAILHATEKRVSPWLKIPEETLPGMVPPPEVPRAYNSSFEGCPVHGMELFRFGNYSWIMEPFRRPWKLKCPVGGEEYPSNDFQRFLDSGMSDRSLLTGGHPDDGWGWRRGGDVHANWFVAYYCHWFWYNYVIPGVLDLSRTYVLTADLPYARRALMLLDRIAEYYPRMDYNSQSRYAREFRPEYTGKIVNLIWETNVIRSLAESISNLRSYILDGGSEAVGRKPEEMITILEERILEEGLRGIRENRIIGNYGMHQDAALVVLKALGDDRKTRCWVKTLFGNPAGGYYHQGLSYAMDNFIHREGISYENAPGYCFTWSRNLLSIATHLRSLGHEFPAMGKLRRMLEAPERIVCLGRFTPAIGDSGSVTSGKIEISGRDALRACRLFPKADFGRLVRPGFSAYEDLFSQRAEVVGKARRAAPRRSDCLGGYGLAILRGRGLECSVYFGRKNGHGHYDRLGLEVFGRGRRLTPDLGYPQFASESKNPPAWERNTISHNTVTVDERRQETGSAGSVHMFHGSPRVQALEVSSNSTYRSTGLYSRTVALVQGKGSFFVDVFRVEGGFAHDYSIHGFEGEFSTGGIRLGRRTGTLAGPRVPYAYLYDDPELEEPDKERSFYSYEGSGFSYLTELEKGTPRGPWWAEWREGDVALRLFFPHPCREAFTASGRPPRKPANPDRLKYIILRNRGEDLRSVFTVVGQACEGEGSISSAQPLEIRGSKGAVGLVVTEGDLEHIVISNIDGGRMETPFMTFEGRFLVMTLRSREPVHLFMDGTGLSTQAFEIRADSIWEGEIVGVEDKTVAVRMGGEHAPDSIVGRFAIIDNGRRSTTFRVLNARRSRADVILQLEDGGRIGRMSAERIDDRTVRTDTELLFSNHGYYEGARLVDIHQGGWVPIDRVEGDRIFLGDDLGDFEFPEAYVQEFGPGDTFRVDVEVSMSLRSGRWRGSANVPCALRIGPRTRRVGPGNFSMGCR
jgi:hypothetical protein